MIGYVTLVGILGSLGLGLSALVQGGRRLPQVAFAAGMLGFAFEAAVTYGLLFPSTTDVGRDWWLNGLRALGLLVPIPWGLFAFGSARRRDAPIPPTWKAGFVAGGVALGAVAAAGLHWPYLVGLPIRDTTLPYAHLTAAGQAAVSLEILATIAVLYGLEPSIRNSWGSTRWQLKYLVLGLGGIFVVRFYLLSQLLLFRLLAPETLAIASVTLVAGLPFVAVGLARTGMLRTELSVSRHFVYRSVVVAICGAYLLLAGLAGWVLSALGIPDKAVWSTVVLFVAVMGLAALLLSESLRWRLRRYISTHFYTDKYDYRQQWRTFTGSLAEAVALDRLCTRLLRSVMDTIGTTRAVLYLAGRTDGTLELTTSAGSTGRPPQTAAFQLGDFVSEPGGVEARLLAALPGPEGATFLASGLVVAVPLPVQGSLLGVIVVGPERTDAPWTQEDLDLLTTLGEQAASAIATAQLSEQVAQSRAFDAFNRLASFVVHDLKNSISALSLLTQNAREHWDDPEFRLDALRTVERTVGRMQGLLGRLSSRQVAESVVLETIRIEPLIEDTVESALRGSRVHAKLELDPVPPVRADADAIQRVLQNLITNAVEAMDGEGEIVLRTFRREALVGCSVTDHGCGMSEEFIRRSLFVPFQTTKKGGWGVGLYQAREILLSHGGAIEVSSQEGRGTAITLLLPEAPG